MVTLKGKPELRPDHSYLTSKCREHGTFSFHILSTSSGERSYDWDRASRCPTHHCRVWWFSNMKSSYDLKVPRFWPKHIKCGLWKWWKPGTNKKNVMVNHHGESWVVPVTQSHSRATLPCQRFWRPAPERLVPGRTRTPPSGSRRTRTTRTRSRWSCNRSWMTKVLPRM